VSSNSVGCGFDSLNLLLKGLFRKILFASLQGNCYMYFKNDTFSYCFLHRERIMEVKSPKSARIVRI
jgi:hypothetical protein